MTSPESHVSSSPELKSVSKRSYFTVRPAISITWATSTVFNGTVFNWTVQFPNKKTKHFFLILQKNSKFYCVFFFVSDQIKKFLNIYKINVCVSMCVCVFLKHFLLVFVPFYLQIKFLAFSSFFK